MRVAAMCVNFSRRRISVPRWVLAFLFCFCLQGASPARAADEVVLFHGKVFTGEPEHPYAEAVAIRGDKFFDHAGKLKTVTLTNGTKFRVPPVYRKPTTLMVAELFKFKDGKILRIDAVEGWVTYGAKPGWSH